MLPFFSCSNCTQVDIEDDNGVPSRIVVMSVQFEDADLMVCFSCYDTALEHEISIRVQVGDEIRSINGLRMDLFLTGCYMKVTRLILRTPARCRA